MSTGKLNNFSLCTNVVQKENEIEWKISEFSSLSEKEDCYFDSPLFSFGHETWYLRILLHYWHAVDKKEKSTGFIGLYLMKKYSGPPIYLEYTVGIKTFNGRKYSEHHRWYMFKDADKGFGVHACITKVELSFRKFDLMPDDGITLFCNLKYPKFAESSKAERSEPLSPFKLSNSASQTGQRQTIASARRKAIVSCCSCDSSGNMKEKWKCRRCTFFNPASSKQCEACYFRKSREDQYIAILSCISSDFAGNMENNWKCRRCTLINPASASKCEACNLLKSSEDRNIESLPNVASAVGNIETSSTNLPLCIICLNKERSIVFQNCGHLITCNDCANSRMRKCPLCREEITNKLKTFIN